MSESIFINYRRGEDQAAAGRLYDQLEATFTRERIFIDVDNIAPGRDFTEELAARVEQCDVFLAVVGRRWADVVDVDGSRRLDNPNDWVRVEIESAQRLGKHIIPVLVDGAEMPRPEKLPDALQPFARRNAARLTHERFRADVQALVVAIGRLREPGRARFEAERSQTPRVAETLAVSTQRARDAAPPAVAGRRIAPLAIAALAALAVIAAGAGIFVWRSSSPSPVTTDSIAKRAGAGAPSIANPAPTKIAAAASTSTPATAAAEPATPAASPVAKASPDASPSREAKLEPVEAQPAPSAAPTVAASSAPTPQPTPAASAPSASPSPLGPAATETGKAPPALEAKASAIEAQPTPAAAPTIATSTAATPAASPDAPPPREAEVRTEKAEPTPSAAPTFVASAPAAAATPPASPLATPTPVAPPPTPATLPASEPQVALAPPAAKPAGTDLAALTPLVAAELRRLGCYNGAATGWDAVDLRLGVDKFAELAKLATLPAEPDVGLLAALKSEPDHFCAPQCSPREVASDGRCVPKTCGANQVLTHDGACVARQPKPQTTAAARAPAPAAGKRCFTFNGSSYCE